MISRANEIHFLNTFKKSPVMPQPVSENNEEVELKKITNQR